MATATFYDFVQRRFVPPDQIPEADGTTNYIVKSSIPILPEEADVLHGLSAQGMEAVVEVLLETAMENISLDMGTF